MSVGVIDADAARGVVKPTHAVVIAGGGPTGMVLAAELALAHVDVAIIERRATLHLEGSRAGGCHSRTLEVLDQRGVADRFLSQGKPMQVAHFADVQLDVSDFPTRHNYGLALWQKHFECILAGWIEELPITLYRGLEVHGFTQDDNGVEIELSNSRSLRAQYLVGCDGGRSRIRKAAGIDFPGWDPTISHIIAEARLAQEAEWGIRHHPSGIHALSKLDDQGLVRVLVTEPRVGYIDAPTLRDLSERLIAVYGTDYGIHSPTWISRFTDMTRQAASYRERRVLLAGDAAHIHYPAGGQGLNLGIQDAVNLGWKLAQVVKGICPDTLLDTYQAERHPIAARVLQNTLAAVALGRNDDRSKATRALVSDLLRMDEPRKRFAGMLSGLDIHYDLGHHDVGHGSGGESAPGDDRPAQSHHTETHPLLGRRMPDLNLTTPNGPQRLFTFLHSARPVFLTLTDSTAFDIAPWADRVQTITAQYTGPWELPVIGSVTAPAAVLVRPDGYVAWVATSPSSQNGLTEALTTWFGPPALA